MTGDRVVHTDVLEWFSSERFRCVITDPPYSRAGAANTARSTSSGAGSEVRASDQFWGHWFARCWANIARHCTDDACALIFTDWRTIGVLEQAIGEVDGWSVTQVAVWDREAMGLGSPMRAGHELIAFARARDFKWEGRRDIRNVFRSRWPYGSHPYHPAEKPVPLLRELVRDFGRGGPVLDPFCGSGSTLVACREESVDALGLERDPETARIAAQRLETRIQLFAPTVVRELDGELWLMNKPTGLSCSARQVASLEALQTQYAVTVGPESADEYGRLWPVTLAS